MTTPLSRLEGSIPIWEAAGTGFPSVGISLTPLLQPELMNVTGTIAGTPATVIHVVGTDMLGQMLTKMNDMQARISDLEETVEALSADIPNDDVIVLRTITREQAKQEILELFQLGETLYYSDLAEHLRIDLPLVVELCQELEEEGEIQVDANVT